MSNLFKYTKRVLTSVLAAAVVLTAIPSTAFGAELPEEDVILDVQEEEVAEAVVEEEAAATDGTGNEEVIIEGGEEEEPDGYAADAKITTGAVAVADDVHYVYAVVDNTGTATLVAANKSDTTYAFDSDNGWSFYVVPLVGYTLPKASGSFDTAKFVKITGSYTYTGETEVKLAASDYTVEPSSITNAGNLTKATYDWSAAAKITFTGGTTFMNAFKNVADGTKTCSAGPTITIAKPDTDTPATANKFVIDMKGNTKNIGVINGTYDTRFYSGDTPATDLDFSGAMESWDNVTDIELVYYDSEGKKANPQPAAYALNEEAPAYDIDTDDDAAIFKFTAAPALEMTTECMNTLYEATVAGYVPTIEITVSQATYYTVTLAGGKKSSGNTVTDYVSIPTAALSSVAAGGTYTLAYSDVTGSKYDNSNRRTVKNDLYYTIGSDTEKKKVTKNGSGNWVIADVDGDIVLYPDTEEIVTLDATAIGGKYSETGVHNTALIWDGTDTTATSVNDAEDAYAYAMEPAKTKGEDYVFTVQATPGNVIDTVKATVRKVDGSAVYKTYTLTVGDYGKCVIEGSKIIGETTVVVTTKPLAGTKYDVMLKTAPSGTKKVYDKTTKTEITNSAGNQLVTDGKDYSFVIEPGNEFGVKSVKYTMGDVTDQALTGTYDKTTGNTSYTIANADSDIVLDIEYTNAVHFNKYGTDKAVVEVNGEVLADDKQVVVPVVAGQNATIKATAAAGSKVTGVYYISEDKKADVTTAIGSLPTGFTKLGDAAGTFVVSESVMDSLASATDSAFIVVTTETEATGVTTKWTFGSDTGAKAGTAHDSLVLYAGGDDADTFASSIKGSAVTGFGTEVVTATFSKGGKAVAGTPTYTLGKTDSKTKVANVSTATITTIGSALPDDKTDVVTAKLEDTNTNKLDKTVYTSTLPLTVNTIADLYDAQENYGFSLEDTVTEGGSYKTGAYDGTTSKTIRERDGAVANDKATFVPVYGKTGAEAAVTAGSLVTGIKWSTSPAYSSTKTSHDFGVYDSGDDLYVNNAYEDTVYIANAQTARDIAVTATIDFVDGSSKTLTDTLTVAPFNYGYIAIPEVKVGASEVYNGLDVNLETKTGGTASGTVSYTVYKIDDSSFFATLLSDTAESDIPDALAAVGKKGIDGYVKAELISAVSTGVTYGAITEADTKDIFTATGSNPYTISATKKGIGYASGTPSIKVGTTPVVVNPFDVNVYESIPGYKLTLKTKNGSAATLKNPELKATSAWAKISPISKKLDSGKKVEAYIYDSVSVGTKLTLPTLDDFETSTLDPRFAIAGWKITDNTASYNLVGEDFTMGIPYSVTNGIVVEPVWAYKYSGNKVNLFDADTESGVDADAAAPIEIAAGSTKNFKIGVYELDPDLFEITDNTDPAYGQPAYSSTVTWPESGLTLDLAGTSNMALVQGEKGVVGVKATGQTAMIQNVGVSYKEGDTSYDVQDADPSDITSVPVKGVEGSEYALTVGTANAVTLEVGETKAIEAAWTLKDSDTKIDFNDPRFARVEIVSNSNEKVATAAEVAYTSDFKHHIAFTADAVGTTNINLNVIDSKGVKTPATVAVTVTAAKTKIIGTDSLGHVVADNEAWEVAYGVDDTLAITIDDGTGATPYVVADTVLDVDDVAVDYYGDDYVAAKNPAKTGTPYSVASGKVVIDSNNTFYEGAVKVAYSKAAGDVFERTIPVKVYMPITLVAQTTGNKAHFTLKNNGTAVEDGKDVTEKVVYSGAASYTVDLSKYTASWNYAGKELEFNGWSDTETAANAVTIDAATGEKSKGGYTIDNTPNAAEAGYIETFAKGDVVTGVGGLDTLYATFGEPAVTVSGLPESIILSDEKESKFTTPDGEIVKGTDLEIITLNMTPPASETTVYVEAEDSDAVYIVADGATTYASVPTSSGIPFTVTTSATSKSRTGKFTVYKLPGVVGTSKINIEAGSNKVTVPVYLNGIYQFKAATGTTPAILHYMENGVDVENGVRTVDGEKIYIKDSAVVANGVVEISSGKYALVRNYELVTTVGKAQYEDKFYYVTEDGTIKTGGLFAGIITSGSYKDNDKKYYAAADGVLAQSELKEVSGKTYYFDNECQMAVASASANLFEATKDGKYYVNAAGEVAISGIYKFEGKDRLFRAEGTIVKHTDADVVAGGGKLVVDGVTYLIADDDTAKRDDIWYNPTVKWTTSWPSTWTKGTALPVMAYQVTFTSANTGKSETTDSTIAAIEPTSVASDAKEVTFVATADLSAFFQDKAGTKKAENKTTSKSYKFKDGGASGQSGQDVDPSGDISIEGLEDTYPWTGKQIKPAFKVYDNVNGRYLAQGVDFTVKYGKNKDAGQGTVTITGKGNYAKTGAAATFTIVKEAAPEDPAGQVNGFGKIAQQTYTGSPIYPETIDVKLKDKTVVTMKSNGDGTYSNSDTSSTKELLVVVTNNVNKGSATVAATGSNGVTKTTTFKINAKSMEGANATGALGNPFEVTISDSADYKIKNTTPEVSIKFNGDELVEGQDYTAKFDAKKGKVTVTGKNNFTKKFVQEGITVNPLNLSDCKLVAVTAYEGLKYTAVKATVLDPDGNLVPAGKYTLTVTPDNDAVGSNGKLIGGKEIKVQAKANGKDSLITGETSEEDFTVAKNFGKASIKVTGSVVYKGEAIELDDDWVNTNVTVKYSGNVIKCGDDFEIVGYTNNVKKGTMTVYAAGKGDFSGTKNFKVKITAKPFGTK